MAVAKGVGLLMGRVLLTGAGRRTLVPRTEARSIAARTPPQRRGTNVAPCGRGGAHLIPEAILPSQWHRRPTADTPARRLMMGLLERAIDDLVAYTGRDEPFAIRLAEHAKAWVTTDEPNWPFSFVHICEMLGLDVEAARHAMLTLPPRPRKLRKTRDLSATELAERAERRATVQGMLRALLHNRWTFERISRAIGVSGSTVRHWMAGHLPASEVAVGELRKLVVSVVGAAA